MLKWALRIGGGLLALIAIAIAGIFIAYSMWMADRKRTLETGSQIALTARGEIEYAILGEGEPRLVIHGTPGGYDQVLAGPRILADAYEGTQVIAVSRPGYLRTPLASGATPEEQADLYASLLDELGFDRVIVMASSGGAPSGLQMAIRHPDRVKGLVLVVPLLTALEGGDRFEAPSELMMMAQNVGIYLMGGQFVKSIMPALDANDPMQVALAKEVVTSIVPMKPRLAGQENDARQFAGLDVDAWSLESVMVPTLILHGNADNNAPYEGSVAAATRIPGAKLVTFDGGDHFVVVTRVREIAARIESFAAGLSEARLPN
jgi:pimeloyl-ACP methyl ester carboxylesterase